MFNSQISRTVLSALGALFFTAATVGAAAGPAHMVETASLVYAGPASQLGGGADA